MALRDTQGRCKPSTNCFKKRIHRLNARMEADYESTCDSPSRQEQSSGTRDIRLGDRGSLTAKIIVKNKVFQHNI